MRARRIAASLAAILAAAHLAAQSQPRQGVDLGAVTAGQTHRQSVSVANNCESAKVVTISHDVPYLSLPASMTLPPGVSAIELALAVPAGVSGAIRGTITLTFPGDATCQPGTATLPINAEIQPAAQATQQGAAVGTDPESETWYEDATGALDEGRALADDAQGKANRGEPGAKEQAQEALEKLEHAGNVVTAGEASGEIGPETASVLRGFIEEAIARATRAIDDEDDPRDEPPPVIYGEEIDDAVDAYEGGFEPTQGVWQDDEVFADFPGKQLTRISPAHLKAELKMIVGRLATLVGIRGRRAEIYFKGMARGTVDVPVKARFTLFQGGWETRLHDTEVLEDRVPLDGAEGASREFHVKVPAPKGIPELGFQRFKPGPYQIVAELFRADTNEATGIKVTVEGEAVETMMPTVLFVPVIFHPANFQQQRLLEEHAAELAIASEEAVPALFPLKPRSLKTTFERVQNLGALSRLHAGLLAKELGLDAFEAQRDVLAATLADRFGTISALGGKGRIFVLMNDADFDLTYRGKAQGGKDDAGAYAMSRKVMVGRVTSDTMTVAHELIHTLPFPWAEESMLALFGKNWHNIPGSNIANGLQVGGDRRDNVSPVMNGHDPQWLTQGTYWHLIDMLRAPVDPELLLVRGLLARVSGGYRATLLPGYQLLGDADLTAGVAGPGRFAIVLRDARGAKLAEYPFDAIWSQPDLAEPRTVVSFAHRVPDSAGVAVVEVIAPGGAVLVSRRLSARPPALRVLTPAANARAVLANGRLRIAWEASDPDGDPLLFNVLYSADNGRRWQVVSHEQTETFFELPLRGRPRQARIKVVATDGMRSVEREVTFSLR